MRRILLLLLAAMLLGSCRTSKTVEVPVVMREAVHDTLYRDVMRTDSIWLHDSIMIDRAGDTVTITHWRDRYHERVVTRDSVVIRRDTIPHEVRTTVTVTRYRVRWWAMVIGGVVLALLAQLAEWVITKVNRGSSAADK